MFGRPCCGMPMPKPCCNDVEYVTECPINKFVEKDCCHTVEHIVPINTHLVTKHIYNHVYKPVHSYSESEVMVNNSPNCGCRPNCNY